MTGQRAAADTAIKKKIYLTGKWTISVYTMGNLASKYAIMKNSTGLLTCCANEQWQTKKAVDKETMWCEQLITDLEVTAGTTAILQDLLPNWRESTNNDPSVSSQEAAICFAAQ